MLNSELLKATGSRRFWVTVLCFAMANAAAWVAYDRLRPQVRRDLLRVDSFSPGADATVERRARFAWHFNVDVGRAGDQPAEPAGVVSPDVPGQWRWSDARTLLFVPTQELPRATKLTFTLKPEKLASADGFRLTRPFVASVQTEPLRLLDARQAAFDESDRFVIELCFSDKVVPAEVLKHLTLRDPAGKPIKCHVHGDAVGEMVRMITDPVPIMREIREEAKFVVELAAGLAGQSGPLGLPQPASWAVVVGTKLMATEASAHCPARGKPRITVRFNHSIDLTKLREVLSIEPAEPFTLDSDWRGASLIGDFKPGTRYTIKLAAPKAGTNPNQYPRPTTLSAFVGDRQSGVWTDHPEGYLSSAGNRTVMAHAVNVGALTVQITRVYDDNIVAWRNALGRYWSSFDSYAKPLATRTFAMPSGRNVIHDVQLSLDEILPPDAARDGVYRVSVSRDRESASESGDYDRYDHYGNEGGSAIVSLSDIGLTAKQGAGTVTVWAMSLRNATPLADVRIRVYSNKNQLLGEGRTNADGLATIATIVPARGEEAAVILADRAMKDAVADSLTWLDLGRSIPLADQDIGGQAYLRKGHEAFVYTDRGVYRPGETVHLRAIVRGEDNAPPTSAFPVKWQIRRPSLRDWKNQVVLLDADGAAGWDIELPTDLPTGRWSATIGLPGEDKSADAFGAVSFQIEEYLPDRMKVATTLEGSAVGEAGALPTFDVAAKPVTIHVQGDYLFGQPAAERKAELSARADEWRFTPKEWAGWVFGDHARLRPSVGGSAISLPSHTLDAKGHTTWEIDQSMVPASAASGDFTPAFMGPWRLAVTGSVLEVGGRAVNASASADIHRVAWYIGARCPTIGSLSAGETHEVQLALVRPAGKVAEESIALEAKVLHDRWNPVLVHRDGRYFYENPRVLTACDDKAATCPAKVTMENGRATIQISVRDGGRYVLHLRDPCSGMVTAWGFDAHAGWSWNQSIDRDNPERLRIDIEPRHDTQMPLMSWALGERTSAWLSGVVAKSEVEAVESEPGFVIGQKAMVTVRSPFAGRLLLTVETDRVIQTKVIDMPRPVVRVPIDITDECRPNAYIAAAVVRGVEPDSPWRIHRAAGAVRLRVDRADRAMKVQVAAASEIRPQSTLPIAVRVTGDDGKPVANAAVTVTAVDEGVLRLTRFATPDPLAFFLADRALGTQWADLYSRLMPEVPRPEKNSAVGGDGDGADNGAESDDPRHRSPISARRVRSMAVFSGVLHTDAEGAAQVNFPVGQFIGQARIMAVAYGGPRFGSADQNVVVRSPLIVQSSWPRFAAPGDRFSVPLTVFNNTSTDGEVAVRVELLDGGETPNPLALGGNAKRTADLPPIRIKAGGQATLGFDIAVGAAAGVGKARIVATLGSESFAEDAELPIRPANPAITVGQYAIVTPDQPLKPGPTTRMLAGTESLQLRILAKPTLTIPEGLDYLLRYPYGCAEQTISTIYPLIALSDIGEQIAPGVFGRDIVQPRVQAGITRLIGLQTPDGGLAMWPGHHESWPYASVRGAQLLVEAQAAGHAVPSDFRANLMRYVRELLDASTDDASTVEVQCHAAYVLALAKTPHRSAMSRLTELVNKLPQNNSGRFWLAQAWLLSGRADMVAGLIPKVLPTPRQDRQLGGTLASPVRDRAVLLNTLLTVQPDNPAIPTLAQQLAESGRGGGWRSTQDASFAIIALGKYLRATKNELPFESVELRSADRQLAAGSAAKPLVWDAAPDSSGTLVPADLAVQVAGPAGCRAYVALIQSGVPLDPPPPEDSGVKIRRRYLDERGVELDAANVRTGQLVQVELSISSPSSLQNVVIEDLLPAGLEIENPRLQTTAHGEQVRPGAASVNGFDLQRTDFRDDRFILMAHVGEGEVRYSYLARAVTPGQYVIPPVRGECMYDRGICSLWRPERTIMIVRGDAVRNIAATEQ